MLSTSERVAVVTGGSGGIGRACAERLGRDGFAVAVAYGDGAERADQTASAVIVAGGRALAIAGDVADSTAMAAVFDEVERAFGGIDVVVHTAGIRAFAPIEGTDLEVFDRVHRVNVRGTFVVDQLAAGRVRGGGAIINVSTSTTRTAPPGFGTYASSKAAVEAFTLILARELRGRDITVNAVAPGPTTTSSFAEGKTPAELERIASASPMERLGTPEDVADVVSFLAGPGRWVNGQVLHVNGGAA